MICIVKYHPFSSMDDIIRQTHFRERKCSRQTRFPAQAKLQQNYFFTQALVVQRHIFLLSSDLVKMIHSPAWLAIG